MIGQTVAQYEVTGRIGAGGMREAYLPTRTKVDRPVALRSVPESLRGVAEGQAGAPGHDYVCQSDTDGAKLILGTVE